jgi:hypothetical protein
MTPTDLRGLRLVQDLNGRPSRPSALGWALFPVPTHGYKDGRTDHRKNQGMALAGGRVMRRLKDMGLITIYSTKDGHETIYRLTEAGIAALKQT